MDIWLIRSGVKTGPFPDYEIRRKVERGELDADARIWYDGLPEWTEISKVDLFKDEFTDKPRGSLRPYLRNTWSGRRAARTNPGKMPKRHLGRRFWARWLDLTIYSALWWLGMYLAGRDIGSAIRNPWLLLPMYIPWFTLEAWLLHRYGRTPGKWLMGLRVSNEDGSELPLKAAVWRSLRVMVTGVGFGWGMLSVLCQAMSWFTARRIGKPIWDFLGNHKVSAEPLNPFKIVGLVIGFIVAANLQMAVRGPHEREAIIEVFPEMEKHMEKHDDWYFPVKK